MKKLHNEIVSYLEWCAEKFLSYRPRSESELRRYLLQKIKKRHPDAIDDQEDYIDAVVDKYKETNGINDEEFIGWWVQERSDFKPKGERMLRQELRQKGVSSELLDEYFSMHPLEEGTLLKQLFEKKAYYVDFSSKKAVDKLVQFFLRRGFSYSEIKKAIEEFNNVE